MNILQTITQWYGRQTTRTKIIAGICAVILLLVIVGSGRKSTTSTIETVKKGTLIKTVTASGTVVSSTDLSLGFEQSKMVSSVAVSVGTKVKKGDILATLSNGTERAAVASARGALLAARARYAKVLEGSSSEEVKLAQVELANAKRTLLSEGLQAKPEEIDVTVIPTISGTYTGSEGEYRLEFDKLSQNTLEYSGIETGKVRIIENVSQKIGTKGLYIQFPLGSFGSISTGTVWVVSIPNIESSSYIANKATVDQKEAALALTQATARQADVDAALADVVTAQAGVDSAIASLEKTILRAPADGTITAVDVKIGEIASVGKQAVALQDVSNLYLEANINESNIKSIAVGQPVEVTFDAFPGDTYHAAVSSIDPAATIENNVVNYKIKALLTETDTARPGMTANMTIRTAELPQVLTLPRRVVKENEGVSTVQKIIDQRKKKTIDQQVTLGLTGDGDVVEIQQGLSEGDTVLWVTSK